MIDQTELESSERVSPETLRQLTHIGIGLLAITLRWLTWQQAASLAAIAILFNWLVLPHTGVRVIARGERGTDRGLILYPVVVLSLILFFRTHLEVAAAAWAVLAFGDGASTLIGRILEGRRLSWNPKKTWAGSIAFVEVALPAAWLISTIVGPWHGLVIPRLAAMFLCTILCALVESLDLGIDDNLTIGLTAALVLWVSLSITHIEKIALDQMAIRWLLVHLALAVTAWLLRTINISGLIGGLIIGGMIIVFAGWSLYVVLLAFFVIGTGATKLGWARKARLGVAQEGGGRRGFGHAFSNTGVAAFCALAIWFWPHRTELLWIAAVGALATAAADTSGSEIGQWLGRKAWMPLTFRSAPPGTEGAMSVEGTLAGAAAGFLLAAIGVWSLGMKTTSLPVAVATHLHQGHLLAVIGASAFAGSWLESVVGSWNRNRVEPIRNGVLNFLNTAIGALLSVLLARFFLGL